MSINDDKIGYKKPPIYQRFKPGQSGNPKGRPRGVKNFATELKEEANETIPITESGKSRKVTKSRAILKRMFAKALNGDVKAASFILNFLRILNESSPNQTTEEQLSADDAAILEDYLRRHASSPTIPPSGDAYE